MKVEKLKKDLLKEFPEVVEALDMAMPHLKKYALLNTAAEKAFLKVCDILLNIKIDNIKVGDKIKISLFNHKTGIILEIDGNSILIEDDLGSNEWWDIHFITLL